MIIAILTKYTYVGHGLRRYLETEKNGEGIKKDGLSPNARSWLMVTDSLLTPAYNLLSSILIVFHSIYFPDSYKTLNSTHQLLSLGATYLAP